MATKKPRASITFEPHIYETLCRFAELQGKSVSKVLGELLDGIHPPLMRTVALLEAARGAPEQVREGLRGTLEAMEAEITQDYGSGLEQLDWLRGEIEQGKAGTRQPEAGASALSPAGANPHVVTRGSGSNRGGGKKGPKAKRGKGSSRSRRIRRSGG